MIGRSHPAAAVLHVTTVVAAYTALFTLLFAGPIATHTYLADSDLYEYYLPIFLAPITTWSTFEFSGLPAFADPGDFTVYPTHFLFARVIGSWTGFLVSTFVLAAAFTYAYVYRLTGSRAAAAFAGAAYAMCEAMLERIPHLGILNCFAWLPLILLAIEGVRGEHRRTWIAVGGAAVACAFLAGHPQPAVYTVYFTALYALAGGVADRLDRRYFMSVAAMFALAGLLAAVKAVPLAEASAVMARQEVNVGQFIYHGNSVPELLSFLFPTILHDGREAPTYVGLTTLAFAMMGVTLVRRDWRIVFWTCVAAFAVLMGAGAATPVPQLAYAVIPLYQKFRVAARHLFLAAFAAVFIAACAIAALQRGDMSWRRTRAAVGALAGLVGAAAVLQAWMPSMFAYEQRRIPAIVLPILPTSVWIQLGIALLSLTAVLLAARRRGAGVTMAVATIVLCGDLVNAVPYSVRTGLDFTTIPRDAARPDVHALKLARALAPLHQRALAFGGTQGDAVLPAAWARLWQIPIAGGYGPMLLDRYSRLGSIGTNGSVRPSVLSAADRSLDMMAVRYVMVQARDVPSPETFEREGFTWGRTEMGIPVGRPDCNIPYPRTASVPLPPDVEVHAIGLVTHLVCGEDIPQDTVAVRLSLVGADGSRQEHEMRAGVETAETGLESSDISDRVRHHGPAIRFEDAAARGIRSFTRLTLAKPVRGGRIDVETPQPLGWLSIDRISFMDGSGHSHPVATPALWLDDAERWRLTERFATSRVTDRGADTQEKGETDYAVYENLRALPLAWIATEVRPISDADAIEAVHRGQLPYGTPFDPKQTALVDPDDGAAPGPFTAGASTASVEEIADGRFVVAVSTTGGGYLVLSENIYPGWRARIDGVPANVRRTNLSMQGVVVPAGRHTVVFELVSNTRRAGIALSIGGLVVCLVLLASDYRQARHSARAHAA
jgi:hypothetical protein